MEKFMSEIVPTAKEAQRLVAESKVARVEDASSITGTSGAAGALVEQALTTPSIIAKLAEYRRADLAMMQARREIEKDVDKKYGQQGWSAQREWTPHYDKNDRLSHVTIDLPNGGTLRVEDAYPAQFSKCVTADDQMGACHKPIQDEIKRLGKPLKATHGDEFNVLSNVITVTKMGELDKYLKPGAGDKKGAAISGTSLEQIAAAARTAVSDYTGGTVLAKPVPTDTQGRKF
jgi:hypothetical protein